MSVVTNVVLLIPCTESHDDDTEYGYHIPGLAYINEWLSTVEKGSLRPVDQYGSNGKEMECHIALGAFNCLDVDGLISAFRAAPWERPEDVQLLVMRQDDDRFSMYSPAQGAE